MTEETWYDPDEALAFGLADAVSDPDEDDREAADMAAVLHAAPIMAKFQHMPQRIAARLVRPREKASRRLVNVTDSVCS